jgi:dTDP-4-dehydrorhamnose reductase
MRQQLQNELNVIINCAGNVDFKAALDIAVKINVSGPLNLLKLA